MAKQWRRYGYDPDTGTWTLLTERSIAGFVRERPAASFGAEDAARYGGSLGLTGRETFYIDVLNEVRGFVRMLRTPRRTPWGPVVQGESTYTPFVVRNAQHVALDTLLEFILEVIGNMVVLAALPGDFTEADVFHALLGAAVSSAVKGTFIAGHNLVANRTQFKIGLNFQDGGKPYRMRQNDDDWSGEWAGNEAVLRWRIGAFDFFNDGFVVSPIASFLGSFAALSVLGVRDSEGERHHLSPGETAAVAAGVAASAAIGTLATGVLRGALQNTAAARFYHRGGVIDFGLIPFLTKLGDKPLGALVMTPLINDSLGAPDINEIAPVPTLPPKLPESIPVLGPISEYPPDGTSDPDRENASS